MIDRDIVEISLGIGCLLFTGAWAVVFGGYTAYLMFKILTGGV